MTTTYWVFASWWMRTSRGLWLNNYFESEQCLKGLSNRPHWSCNLYFVFHVPLSQMCTTLIVSKTVEMTVTCRNSLIFCWKIKTIRPSRKRLGSRFRLSSTSLQYWEANIKYPYSSSTVLHCQTKITCCLNYSHQMEGHLREPSQAPRH